LSKGASSSKSIRHGNSTTIFGSAKNHLALQVEDHSSKYGNLEGIISKGEYGAGTVEIWDPSTYELEEWTDDVIVVMLHGQPKKVYFRPSMRSRESAVW